MLRSLISVLALTLAACAAPQVAAAPPLVMADDTALDDTLSGVGVGLRAETLQSTTDGNVQSNQEPKIFWAGQHQISLLDVTPRPGEPDAPIVAKLRVVRLGE